RLPDLLAQYREQASQVVQDAVEEASKRMLGDFRDNLQKAFPESRRAANLVTRSVFPDRGVSINAAGSVVARGGQNSAWPAPLRLFAEGGSIVPKVAGGALAIPTARVPMAERGRRMTPDEVQRSFGERLTLVPAKKGKGWGYLILTKQTIGRSGRVRGATKRRVGQGRSARGIVMFILVPRATVTKRLDFDAIAQKWAGLMPSLLDQAAARIIEGGRS
ncbi:MAG TPA: DUF6441 family protein, partial [Geminicoccaceae bacterium]